MLTDLSITQIKEPDLTDLTSPLVYKEFNNLNTNTRLYRFNPPFLNFYRHVVKF